MAFQPSRLIPGLAMFVALLLLYVIHPIAGWAALSMVAVVTVVSRRRRASKVTLLPPTY